jgi:hypothetical protein
MPATPPPKSPSSPINTTPYCVTTHLLANPPPLYRYLVEEFQLLLPPTSCHVVAAFSLSSLSPPGFASSACSSAMEPPRQCRRRQRPSVNSPLVVWFSAYSSPSCPSSSILRHVASRLSSLPLTPSNMNPLAPAFTPRSTSPTIPLTDNDDALPESTPAMQWRSLFNYAHNYHLFYLQLSRQAATLSEINLKNNAPWGDVMPCPKQKNIFCLYSQNINGLKLDNEGGDLATISDFFNTYQCDVVGFSELNLNVSKYKVKKLIADTLNRLFEAHSLSMSTSEIPFEDLYKPGGTLTAVFNHVDGPLEYHVINWQTPPRDSFCVRLSGGCQGYTWSFHGLPTASIVPPFGRSDDEPLTSLLCRSQSLPSDPTVHTFGFRNYGGLE